MSDALGGSLPAVGDRIEVVRWDTPPGSVIDDNRTVPPGTQGTVWSVTPEVGQIGVEWDNGSRLFLLIGRDRWHSATEGET